MTTLIDYALMAGASYISNRAEINRIPAQTAKGDVFEFIFQTGTKRVSVAINFQPPCRVVHASI